MTELCFPKDRRGQRVKTTVVLFNGSFPNTEPEGLLLGGGATGEITRVATHTEADVPSYIVDFGERLLIGCFEEEVTVL